ncbi:MAG: SDR family NAD(P)-dependent oxidoreductase [Nitrososphaerales archaeon]
MHELKNKVAIITGSGRGIGRATALTLAKEGMKIVVNSRTEKEIQETVRMIEGLGATAFGLRADVATSAEVTALVQRTVDKFGKIDVLVNNAGIAFVKQLIDTNEDEWDATLDINLKGAFLCSKVVLPIMIRQRSGVIVNISSGAGKTGFSEISAYCASKFGLIGLTESLAREVDKYNIRVIALCPGAVATRMQEETDPEWYASHRHGMLKAEDVAKKVSAAIRGKYRSGSSIDV